MIVVQLAVMAISHPSISEVVGPEPLIKAHTDSEAVRVICLRGNGFRASGDLYFVENGKISALSESSKAIKPTRRLISSPKGEQIACLTFDPYRPGECELRIYGFVKRLDRLARFVGPEADAPTSWVWTDAELRYITRDGRLFSFRPGWPAPRRATFVAPKRHTAPAFDEPQAKLLGEIPAWQAQAVHGFLVRTVAGRALAKGFEESEAPLEAILLGTLANVGLSHSYFVRGQLDVRKVGRVIRFLFNRIDGVEVYEVSANGMFSYVARLEPPPGCRVFEARFSANTHAIIAAVINVDKPVVEDRVLLPGGHPPSHVPALWQHSLPKGKWSKILPEIGRFLVFG